MPEDGAREGEGPPHRVRRDGASPVSCQILLSESVVYAVSHPGTQGPEGSPSARAGGRLFFGLGQKSSDPSLHCPSQSLPGPEGKVRPLALCQVASHPDSLTDAVASCQHCYLITAIRFFCSRHDFIPLGCTGGSVGKNSLKPGSRNPGTRLERQSHPTHLPARSPGDFLCQEMALRFWGESRQPHTWVPDLGLSLPLAFLDTPLQSCALSLPIADCITAPIAALAVQVARAQASHR